MLFKTGSTVYIKNCTDTSKYVKDHNYGKVKLQTH